jgi:hypothetical protein
MPNEELTHWERGDRVLQAYETINAAPDMVYVTDENNNNVSRIIADLCKRWVTAAGNLARIDRLG